MNQQDINVRLQLTSCKCSELTNVFVNNLKWGKKCAKIEWKEIILLNAYISLLEDYNVTNTDNNCITEDQLTIMVDNISKLTKICFKPEGYTYYETEQSQFDDSFDDSFG